MRKKLLIVEDNTELLELLRLGFKQAGFSVSTAANGVEGLKKARSVCPDAIILDVVLPEMDGFAVCEALKRADETSAIPIIMLTGLRSEFTRFAGLDSGADEYLMKPIGPDQLLPRVRHWTRAKPSRRVAVEKNQN